MRNRDDDQLLAKQSSASAMFYSDRDKFNTTLEEMRQYSLLKSQQAVAEQLIEDPSIFNYDDFVDKNTKAKAQQIENKKKQSQNHQSRYMTDIINAAEQRKFNQSVVKDKVEATRIQRESDRFGTNEVYVTSAYKKKIEDAKKIEEIEKLQEQQEKLNEANRDNANSNFYKNLFLNSQFAGGDRGIEAQQDSKSLLQRKIERIIQEKQQTRKDTQIQHNFIPDEKEKKSINRSRSRSAQNEKKHHKSHKDRKSKKSKDHHKEQKKEIEKTIQNKKNQQPSAQQSLESIQQKQEVFNSQLTREQKQQNARDRYLQRKQYANQEIINNEEKNQDSSLQI